MQNEYEQYIESQREKKESSLGKQLLAGAVVVGAGMGIVSSARARGLIRDTFETVTDLGNSALARIRNSSLSDKMHETGMILKAMHHATDTKGITYHLRHPNRFQERFQESLTRSIEARRRALQTPLKGQSTLMEELLHGLPYSIKMARYEVINNLRYKSVIEELERTMPQHMKGGLRALLNQQDNSFFTHPSIKKVEQLINSATGAKAAENNWAQALNIKDEEKDQFVRQIFDTLKKYQSDKAFDEKQIKSIMEKHKTRLIEGIKERLKPKDDFFSRMMRNFAESQGLRHVTLKDMREQNLWDPDSIKIPVKGKPHRDGHMGKKLENLAKSERYQGLGLDNLPVDPFLFIDRKGNLHDLRGFEKGFYESMTFFRESFQIPFLRFNPLDLMHWTTYQSIREAPNTYFFKRGNIDVILSSAARTIDKHPLAHLQDAAVTPLDRGYMYTSGRVYDILTGELVKDNVYLGSARFGMLPRMMASVGNLHRYDYRQSGFLRRLFDIGQQEHDSVFGRTASVITKFADPNWTPNAVARLFTEEGFDTSLQVQVFKQVHSDLDTFSKPLSDDVINVLNPYVQKAYGNLGIDLKNLDTPEKVMEAVGKIVKGMDDKLLVGDNNEQLSKGIASMLRSMWRQYSRDPEDFVKGKRILSSASPYVPDSISELTMFVPNMAEEETQLISKIEDAKRLIHQHAIEQIKASEQVNAADIIRDAIRRGELEDNAIYEVADLKALTAVRGFWKDIYEGTDEQVERAGRQFLRMMRAEDERSLAIIQAIDRYSPILGMGPGDKPPQYFGRVGYMLMNEARGHRYALEQYNELIRQGVSPLKAGVKSAWSVLSQPFAGRHNIDNITTATLPFYYYAERLDNALSKVGLGLSQKNRGSMQSILFNQFGRRIVLPYMALQQAMYFDGLTGDFFSDNLADTYVNMHQDVAWFKDITGINRTWKYLASITPGSELFWETPIGGFFKYASFGLFGDSRSEEEVRKYYESGEDPVRKGRWWSIGSNTPWQGGKIEYFQPNWYRRLKSDYKFTDTMYGSESEYWANHWMPTLTNPFAPIRHFITDPDHYVEKHKKDRPYPVDDGGIAELRMVPVVGPLLNRTIGQILNPSSYHPDLEKAHRQYISEINQYIARRYKAATQGGYIETLPGGGYRVYSGGAGGGIGIGGGTGEGDGGIGIGGVGGEGSSGGIGGSAAIDQLTAINEGIASAARSPAPTIDSLDSLRDPDMVAELSDISNPSGLGKMIEDSWYNITEMAGIYGFTVNTLLGYDPANRSITLEPSSRMLSYSRAWWDLEMGGFGGNLSEIGRRYNPRDAYKNYYNPIRNTMPDWLPGPEYFIDFKHGDSLIKIKKGEMRLPGEAYETLHRLHPDPYFGKYGAFDRFKILADVAPYSEQYKFYRRIVSQMNQEGLLTPEMQEEYAEIRDQVSQRRSKYRLFPRKFTYADVIEQEVTITKVLDADTFLTKEFGQHPIKLAGVNVKESATNTREWLSQFIYEGAKVRVAIDADPLFRIRDDTMQTIRAVVYAQKNEEGRAFYESIKGQSLNAILAKRDFGDKNGVTVKDDGSAVATAALYDRFDRRIGSAWETFWHDIVPAIPIVNVFADKFMNIKSPLEMYKDRQVYGKEWRPWHNPWSGWIQPMLEKAANQNPLVAAAGGYGVGWLFGRNKVGRFYGSRIGALAFGLLSSMRVIDEFLGNITPINDDSNYTWIPERRRREREIEEYFDILKYMKYKGLYERARQIALEKEGIDVEKIVSESLERGEKNKAKREYLAVMKKWLAIEEKSGYLDKEFVKEQKKKIRDRLAGIDEDRGLYRLGPYAMQALQYRLQYESTLYGADPYGDMTKIYRALPKKDREFFTYFMNAAPEEREEILRLVPENQRRFYQARWGLEVDEKPSLRAYFANRYLPGPDWEGWRPDVSLDEIKVKVVKNEGLELSEFGLWEDDAKRAEQNNVPEIQPFIPSQLLDVTRIERVLRGAGLNDVEVVMTVEKGLEKHSIRTSLNIVKDRRNEIIEELNRNLGSLL